MIKINVRIGKVLFFVGIVCFLITGCNSQIKKHEDAGSSHLAVLSVAPWGKYYDELKPNFEIDSKKALEQVMPITSAMESKIFDSMGGGFKIALPTTSYSKKETKKSAMGTEDLRTYDETTEKKSGDVSNIGAITNKNNIKTDEMPTYKALFGEEPKVDPILKYTAATALYQEVKLLNRYLEDAACDKQYDSYVVRLQVSIMPKVRAVPYDFYITFSFFSGDNGEQINPKIIPLLVTDNLESTLQMKSSDKLREIAAYLSLMYEGIGAAADFQKKYEEVKNLFGKDINSLMTVGRVSDNTMRVRIGALKQVGSDYTMIPRTHNITVLLLAPKNTNKIKLISKANMIHAVKGDELPRRSDKDYSAIFDNYFDKDVKNKIDKLISTNANDEMLKDLINLINKYKSLRDETKCKAVKCFIRNEDFNESWHDALQKLNDYIERNDWTNYYNTANKLFEYPDQFWLEWTSTVMVGSQWDITTFSLPDTKSQIFCQDVVLLDDGEKSSSISLQGENLISKQLRATLYMQEECKKEIRTGETCKCVQSQNSEKHPFIAESIEVLSGGNVLKMTFPSMKAWGFGKGDHRLEVYEVKDSEKKPLCTGQKVLLIEKPKPIKKEPGFTLKVTTSSIIATKDGRGTLQVTVKKSKDNPPAKIFYDVEGADIENITSKPSNIFVDDGKGERYVNADGTVTFGLNNLKDNSMVALIFSAAEKDSSVKVTVPVDMTK